MPSEIPKLPTDPPVIEFPTVWKVVLQDSLPRMGLIPKSFVCFYLLYFCPTSFWREWAASLVPGVFHQHSEAVLWKLLNIQIIFWWICGGESGLPVIFLHHLRTTSLFLFLINGDCFPLHSILNCELYKVILCSFMLNSNDSSPLYARVHICIYLCI